VVFFAIINTVILTTILVFLSAGNSLAHYGMVIPSDNMIMQGENREINLVLSFSHPFENIGMELVKPQAFFVVKDGKRQDLSDKLLPFFVMDKPAWSTSYTIKRPGAHAFVMEPAAYWEPAEDCFIIHYTKTIAAAFGDDTGWDEELGLKTEIVPLSKPFGLYAGNLFQGIVKVDGKPVPFAQVEVEFYNQDKRAVAPTDYMVTQTIKADKNGVFSYCTPVAGWWGFAALSTSDKKMMHNGEKKDIELGAIIWVKFEKWQEK